MIGSTIEGISTSHLSVCQGAIVVPAGKLDGNPAGGAIHHDGRVMGRSQNAGPGRPPWRKRTAGANPRAENHFAGPTGHAPERLKRGRRLSAVTFMRRRDLLTEPPPVGCIQRDDRADDARFGDLFGRLRQTRQ